MATRKFQSPLLAAKKSSVNKSDKSEENKSAEENKSVEETVKTEAEDTKPLQPELEVKPEPQPEPQQPEESEDLRTIDQEETELLVANETVDVDLALPSAPQRHHRHSPNKASDRQFSFKDMYSQFTPEHGHHMDAKIMKPKVPPRADEVYQVEIEDVRNALVVISLGMLLFGLFTSVSLLTGPIIAGTFGGVTMLLTGVVALRLSVGSVLMFRASKRFQMLLSRNPSRDDFV